MYSKLSVYSKTKTVNSLYLGTFVPKTVPRATNDILFEITTVYTYRPDLLAFDLYGNKELWWVFAQRNPDVIKDPVYDFVAGTQIYLPQARLLRQSLGR